MMMRENKFRIENGIRKIFDSLSLTFVFSLLLFSLSLFSMANGQRPDLDVAKDYTGPQFNLDWSQFRSDSLDELTRLEIYYKIPNTGLTFVSTDSGYLAEYEITISIFHKDARAAKRVISRKYLVADYARTNLRADFIVNAVMFDLEHGKYKVEATLRDRNSARSRKISTKIKLSNLSPSKRPKLSGIEFLYSAKTVEEGGKRFRKGEIIAVPAVEKAMEGGKEGGPVLFYFEIYAGKDSKLNALIDTRIKNRTSGQVYRDTLYVMMDEPVIRQVRQVDMSEFRPGKYEVSIELLERRKKTVDHRTADFEVNWSLLGMMKHDFKTVISQLEHIGNANDIRPLKDAQTIEERLRAWKEFWDLRDPTPDSDQNEARISFYYRVRYANTYFSAPKRDGWKSDRGMILLQYGSPDESVDEPLSQNLRAYQIWYYYNYDGQPLRFVFLDEYGDEDFRLQYPFDGRIR